VTGFAVHGAVHAARTDAMCIMHLHNANGIAVGIQEHGLLALSQHALRFYGQADYHDYEGLALSAQEQGRLVQRLGIFPVLFLRNHGTLVCVRTVAEAFVLMDTLDKACAFQLKGQAGQSADAAFARGVPKNALRTDRRRRSGRQFGMAGAASPP
jgi:ribulose-5-phosphate 4-epimerase/fuculose-1-phosphate aldolase